MIFSANKQRFTQMDVNRFRTEQGMFSLASLWLWRISGSLAARRTLFFIVTRFKSYLSLRDCVCLRGRLESDTVSMDWVKAPLLKALLRRVSSLGVWNVRATTVFSWKTREYFKANLLAKSSTLAILLNQLFNDVHPVMKQAAKPQRWAITPQTRAVLSPPSGRRYRSMHTTTTTHKSSFSHRASPWPTPKSVQHCPCV